MPLKIFKSVFPKATIELLHATKQLSTYKIMYNNSNMEQLDISSVSLKQKDKVIRCRFL